MPLWGAAVLEPRLFRGHGGLRRLHALEQKGGVFPGVAEVGHRTRHEGRVRACHGDGRRAVRGARADRGARHAGGGVDGGHGGGVRRRHLDDNGELLSEERRHGVAVRGGGQRDLHAHVGIGERHLQHRSNEAAVTHVVPCGNHSVCDECLRRLPRSLEVRTVFHVGRVVPDLVVRLRQRGAPEAPLAVLGPELHQEYRARAGQLEVGGDSFGDVRNGNVSGHHDGPWRLDHLAGGARSHR
mmetsp:Transcript_8264/g.20506  ORF Transcript_8264/g.20506 Transcript_8264/m.20506 type:complete len:241 (-) Transcript_8264:2504-3226(-)